MVSGPLSVVSGGVEVRGCKWSLMSLRDPNVVRANLPLIVGLFNKGVQVGLERASRARARARANRLVRRCFFVGTCKLTACNTSARFFLSVRPNWQRVGSGCLRLFSRDDLWLRAVFTSGVRHSAAVFYSSGIVEKTVVTISFGTPRILRRVSTHFPKRNAGPLWGSGWEWAL
jgi:hypothetical protein